MYKSDSFLIHAALHWTFDHTVLLYRVPDSENIKQEQAEKKEAVTVQFDRIRTVIQANQESIRF